jgi:MoxR-like ATPase
MLDEHAASDKVEDIEPVTEVSMIRAAQRGVTAIHASDPLRRYVVAVCEATRNDSRVDLGASPRASLMLFRAAKALAALEGRDHALPDDVQALAPAVLAHRLALAPGTISGNATEVVAEALERVPAL